MSRRRPVAALAAAALALSVAAVAAPVSAGATVAAPTATHFGGSGFDGCVAPSSGFMRSWLASPYRAMNFYLGGSQLASDCKSQPELDHQWVHTVRANGWRLIPTWVGLQAPCRTNSSKQTFHRSNARERGRIAARSAVDRMRTLHIGRHNPVYVDLEPYNVSNSRCVGAVLDYVEAWTNTMHRLHYVAGVYAHATQGIEPIARHANPRPDDVWWALFNGDPTTSYPTLHGHWKHHRIHQYSAQSNSQKTTYNGQSLSIDKDSVHADVVGRITMPKRTGAGPFSYRASPPYDQTTHARLELNERSAPHSNATLTGTYAYGDKLSVVCQTTGDAFYGDNIWDRLSDGNYVFDLYTTTSGGLGRMPGIPAC